MYLKKNYVFNQATLKTAFYYSDFSNIFVLHHNDIYLHIHHNDSYCQINSTLQILYFFLFHSSKVLVFKSWLTCGRQINNFNIYVVMVEKANQKRLENNRK